MKLFGKQAQEASIQQRHEELKARSIQLARDHADKDLPGEKDASIAPYVKNITNAYQSLMTERTSRISSSGQQEMMDTKAAAHQEREVRIKQQRDEKRQKLRKLNDDRTKVADTYQGSRVVLTWVFIVFLALLEAAFTYRAFSLFDSNSPVTQAMVFCGLFVFYIFLPTALIAAYRQTEDSPNRWAYRAVIAVIVVGGFFVLGTLRTLYLKNMALTSLSVAHGGGVTLKPYFFVGINLLFLFVSVIAAMRLPSIDEVRDHKSAKSLDAAVRKAELEIERLDQEWHSMPDRKFSSHLSHAQSKGNAADLMRTINAMYHECVGLYISENLIMRSGGRPACFDKPLDDLK